MPGTQRVGQQLAHRFFELSGHYPEAITVISYNLKQDRFKSLHRAAIHWPEDRFKFVGTELPVAAEGALAGEVGFLFLSS